MKEITIEEKAKRYDEALERARTEYKNHESFNGFREMLLRIFPELKESEDEKIRKALIKYYSFDKDGGSHALDNITPKQIVTWLEKQGEKFQYWKPSEEQLEALDYAYNSCPDTEIGNYYEGVLGTIIDDLHKLSEKQGEQKLPIDKLPSEMKSIGESLGFTTQEECDKYNQMATDLIMSDDDKDEQKLADKVEPKFKVKYAGSEYNVFETKDIAGVTFYGIEDEPNHIDYVKADNCEIISGYGIKESGLSIPTKPVMFSEQKSAWSEEDETTKNNISHIIRQYDKISKRENQPCWYVGDCLLWMQNIKDRVQPKQEWSEEDEERIKNIISVLDVQVCWNGATGKKGNPYQKEIDWLKSLKPQNKYAYNPYKAVVESIAEMCKHYDKASHSGLRDFYDNVKVKCKDAKEYDSLYPQNKWKPSDEQIDVIEAVINNRSFQRRHLNSLYEQLKKLKLE